MAVGIGIKGVRELFPEYYLEMLYEIYTPKEVDLILKSYLLGRKTTFRINRLKEDGDKVLDELKRKNIKVDRCTCYKDVYILKEKQDRLLQGLEAYKNGNIYLQNLSSIMPAEILDVNKKDKVLDMCAAPGGKTLKLAEKMNNEGVIVANEVNKIRYERLKFNLEKLGAKNVTSLNLDGRRLMHIYKEYFDKILLDVPCSGEGTINIKNTKKLKLLKNSPFVKVQRELIQSAFVALKKGGIMLYSTCTISPQENEEVINYLLKRHKDAEILPINLNITNYKSGIISFKDKVYDERIGKSIRIIPNEFMEGFYICLISKKS